MILLKNQTNDIIEKSNEWLFKRMTNLQIHKFNEIKIDDQNLIAT